MSTARGRVEAFVPGELLPRVGREGKKYTKITGVKDRNAAGSEKFKR